MNEKRYQPFTFRFLNESDADVIAELKAQSNAIGYVRELIRADLKSRHQAEVMTTEMTGEHSVVFRGNKKAAVDALIRYVRDTYGILFVENVFANNTKGGKAQ